jgi:hypothetical protein
MDQTPADIFAKLWGDLSAHASGLPARKPKGFSHLKKTASSILAEATAADLVKLERWTATGPLECLAGAAAIDDWHWDIARSGGSITHLSLDSFLGGLHYRGLLRLRAPNKALGEPDELVVSSSLDDFLQSVNILLRSVLMHPSEVELMQETLKTRFSSHKRLTEIEETLAKVRQQFASPSEDQKAPG